MLFSPKPPKLAPRVLQKESVSDVAKEVQSTASISTVSQETLSTVSAPIEPAPQPLPSFSPSTLSKNIPTAETLSRFQRPQQMAESRPIEPLQNVADTEEVDVSTAPMEPHMEIEENGRKVFRARSIQDVGFADLWFTPEKIAYIRDKETKFALIPFVTDDLDDFHKALDQGYTGSSSYALKFEGESYRVERVLTISGIQYNCRKMPGRTPSIYKLGLPEHVVRHMVSLAQEAGLILFAGPTGMGKTTTASALMREFLETHGGFLYTIEDPPEMPLDGLYYAKNGALGLCKQTPVENERWEDGLKSALRSRPRYILVGEIRTPETASQTLRAATSGHLVLSTIHANSVEDALNSMIKYASGAGLDEKLVADLLARGILAVVHQQLEGTKVLRPVIHTAFANPNPLAADQMRMAIRDGRINLGTLMEAQATKMFQGKPLFKEL